MKRNQVKKIATIFFLIMLFVFTTKNSFASEEQASLIINSTSSVQTDYQALNLDSESIMDVKSYQITLRAGFINRYENKFYIYLSYVGDATNLTSDGYIKEFTFDDVTYKATFINKYENKLGCTISKYSIDYTTTSDVSKYEIEFQQARFYSPLSEKEEYYQTSALMQFGWDADKYYFKITYKRNIQVIGQVFYFDWDYSSGTWKDFFLRYFQQNEFPKRRLYYFAFNLYDKELASYFTVDRINSIYMSYKATLTSSVSDKWGTDTETTVEENNNQLVEAGKKQIESNSSFLFSRIWFTYDYIGEVKDLTDATKKDEVKDYSYYSYFGNFEGYDVGTVTTSGSGSYSQSTKKKSVEMDEVYAYHINYDKDGINYDVDCDSLIRQEIPSPIVPGKPGTTETRFEKLLKKVLSFIKKLASAIASAFKWIWKGGIKRVLLIILCVILALFLIKKLCEVGISAFLQLCLKSLIGVWHVIKWILLLPVKLVQWIIALF